MSSSAASISLEQLQRPHLEVADVFRLHGAAYRRSHRLPVPQLEVMSAIERCRTAALGGHVSECDACGHQRISYNSCRNRHCPKCQGSARHKWVEAQTAALLPIEYFHVVFTLPEALNSVLRWNRRLMLGMLFEAASKTLLEFAARHLGGELGVTMVLHTWGQTMCEHAHVHCIVTGGALARDGSRWTSCRAGYLFPVRALSQVFRAKYCALLKRAFDQGTLHGSESLAILTSAESFADYHRGLREKAWVVYAKRPFAGPQQVIEYVGRYTHRVAISNRRIVGVDQATVSFRWKDYRDGEQVKVMRLAAGEFIRRFLAHVLPPEFVRIRHYGILANGRRKEKLARCRELLAGHHVDRSASERPTGADPQEVRDETEQQQRCERCGIGWMQRREELPLKCVAPPGDGERVVSITHRGRGSPAL
jgi:predicted Zn-ribbon and HTH transcriptional regulator